MPAWKKTNVGNRKKPYRKSYKTVENRSNSDIFRTVLYGFLHFSAFSYGDLQFSIRFVKSFELVPKIETYENVRKCSKT